MIEQVPVESKVFLLFLSIFSEIIKNLETTSNNA